MAHFLRKGTLFQIFIFSSELLQPVALKSLFIFTIGGDIKNRSRVFGLIICMKSMPPLKCSRS